MTQSLANHFQGPIPNVFDEVHAFWIAGGSCDGCSIATVGATSPSVENLLNGTIPGAAKVILHHPVLAVNAGEAFIEPFRLAAKGELGAPFVVLCEGSIMDESLAAETGGYWSGLGADEDENGDPQPIPSSSWVTRMSVHAAAVIAVGTCATWGGVPAAANNPTNAASVMDLLGEDYRSILGLPVVNIPGCAPQGDNITETIAAVLLFLNGLAPLPEFDELGRPQWLFDETVHRGCTRAGFYEEGTFAEEHGDKECLVEIGCWGPVVQCNINKRGAINNAGGCMNVGAPCIGCTMPGFPDSFAPFYKTPPGTMVSSNISRVTGTVIRNLREMSMGNLNRTTKWDKDGHVPSGWGHVKEPNLVKKVVKYAYQKMQFSDSPKPGSK
ncbi:hydrogenase expression protein HypE [Maribacter algarum]|uniref:Hydrogenase expression protein HypE n=1 Tax=Maribacter algarum (ex Zhang et al. 2020) TaxID=2578118 RepID=A0A5S3PPZ0_9FLAO|nr:hydrogenase expression protein HypE [Maribacter algarum]TMM56699.1 hydrogenase expression protein HypE [Maribacter algarum]